MSPRQFILAVIAGLLLWLPVCASLFCLLVICC